MLTQPQLMVGLLEAIRQPQGMQGKQQLSFAAQLPDQTLTQRCDAWCRRLTAGAALTIQHRSAGRRPPR